MDKTHRLYVRLIQKGSIIRLTLSSNGQSHHALLQSKFFLNGHLLRITLGRKDPTIRVVPSKAIP